VLLGAAHDQDEAVIPVQVLLHIGPAKLFEKSCHVLVLL
jgi:hypothetical protein